MLINITELLVSPLPGLEEIAALQLVSSLSRVSPFFQKSDTRY